MKNGFHKISNLPLKMKFEENDFLEAQGSEMKKRTQVASKSEIVRPIHARKVSRSDEATMLWVKIFKILVVKDAKLGLGMHPHCREKSLKSTLRTRFSGYNIVYPPP